MASRASQHQRWKGIVAEPRTDGRADRPCTLCIWPCGLCVSGPPGPRLRPSHSWVLGEGREGLKERF